MKVIVGSKNPVKAQAVQQAFAEMFPEEVVEVVSYDAASGVSEQPIGTEETKTGARNRAVHCRDKYPEADFWVGLEGGLVEDEETYRTVAWMCVIHHDGRMSFAPSAGFLLPPQVTRRIKDGEELGVATDIVFGSVNSKHKGGTIGILTNDLVTRTDMYKVALIFALVPFLKSELYKEN